MNRTPTPDAKAGTAVTTFPTETVLLTGAQLADGTGQPLRAADILVEQGRISAVEPPGTLPDTHPTRDLTGLVLAPGFIDVHSHADNAPLLPYDDTSKILQGVTTEVVGNCGFSLAPHATNHSDAHSTFLQRLFPPQELSWTDFHDLFAHTDQAGYVTNYCPLIGHGTLRVAALGMTDHPADDAAVHLMRTALEEGMTAGAFGFSTGLIYPPATFSTTEELTALAEVLGGDGLYATHMRDEGEHLLDSIRESVRIGDIAGRTHLSHLKAAGAASWGSLQSALDLIHRARQDGRTILHDVYPYTASSTTLTTMLPPEYLTGGADEILTRLDSTSGRADLHKSLSESEDWNDVLIATTASHDHEGATISEIATARGDRPVDTLINILLAEQLRVSMIHFSMHEDDLEHALRDEHTMIGSDGLPPGTGGRPHPRLYGTFPRVLSRYARERGIFDIPEAVRRMTSLPAHTFRIPERGVISPGYIADLVAFDPESITDVGDYRDPIHSPAGIPWVCQAGRTVVDRSEYIGARSGQRLAPRT